MIRNSSSITSVYATQIPKILTAETEQKAKEIYSSMITQVNKMGAIELHEFDNEMFRKFKTSLGITWGFPPNDPNSGYSKLKVDSLFGNSAYNKEIPEDIIRK